ncbi:NAD(P)-binding protein [Sparassis latifolia]
MLSTLTNLFPPKPKWAVEQMPDLLGQVIIVTGGNAGIGRETVKALLSHNAKVYMAGRNPEKMQLAIKELQEETGREALPMVVDLADLSSIKAAAEEFLSKEERLDVLFNNAGAVYPPVEEITAQGYDMQFGTNVLGHFYFTKLLIPLLLSTAQSSATRKARVVHTASMGHLYVSGIDYHIVEDCPRRRAHSSIQLYFHSKFGNVVIAKEFHRRYSNRGLVSVSLHPGNTKLDNERHTSLLARVVGLTNPLQSSTQMGALTQLYAGTAPEGVEFGGKYLIPWARIGKARREANDPNVGQRLWEWLEEQVKKWLDEQAPE